MSTITPVAPQNKQAEEIKLPESWAIILHVDPAAFDKTRWATAMHVMTDHMGVGEDEARMAADVASKTGRSLVTATTKDLATTMIEESRNCIALIFSGRMSFKMEVL